MADDRLERIRTRFAGHNRPEVDEDVDWLLGEVDSLRRQLEHQVHGRDHG